MLRGQVAPICKARGCPAAGVSLLSCVLLASVCPCGNSGSWTVFPGALGSGAYTTGIVLPGYTAPSAWSRLPSCSQAAKPPSSWSRHLSFSGGPAGYALQPFRELGPQSVACSPPGHSSSVSAPGSLRASLPLLGSCPCFLGVPFCPGRLAKLLLLRAWAFLSWGHSPAALARLLAGPLPLGCFFYFFIFFPVFLPC